MHIYVFNVALLVAWLLVISGGMLISIGAGLIGGGLLLIVLVAWAIKLGGGVYAPEPNRKIGNT